MTIQLDMTARELAFARDGLFYVLKNVDREHSDDYIVEIASLLARLHIAWIKSIHN